MKMKVFECLKKILNSIEKQEFEHREIEQKERSRRVKLKTILETRIKKVEIKSSTSQNNEEEIEIWEFHFENGRNFQKKFMKGSSDYKVGDKVNLFVYSDNIIRDMRHANRLVLVWKR